MPVSLKSNSAYLLPACPDNKMDFNRDFLDGNWFAHNRDLPKCIFGGGRSHFAWIKNHNFFPPRSTLLGTSIGTGWFVSKAPRSTLLWGFFTNVHGRDCKSWGSIFPTSPSRCCCEARTALDTQAIRTTPSGGESLFDASQIQDCNDREVTWLVFTVESSLVYLQAKPWCSSFGAQDRMVR